MQRRSISPLAAFLVTLMVIVLSAMPISCSRNSVSTVANPLQTAVSTSSKNIRGLFLNSINLPTQDSERIKRFIINDRTVSGGNLIVPWSKIDRDPNVTPQYDWSYINETAKPWIDAGKKINLLAWGAAQKSEQEIDGKSMTPEYILKQVETVSCQCKADGECDLNPPATPVFWDEDYRQYYRQFVTALIAEYSNKPWIGYFRFGIGVGAESYPANGVSYDRNPCNDAWEKPTIGLTPAVWQQHSLDFVEFLGTVSSPKPILVTINSYGNSDDIAIEVAAKAASVGLGIGTQGLTEKAIELYNAGKACYADWCNLFEQYNQQIPLEIQTAAQSNPTDKGRVGALPPLLDFAIARGADIIELYQAEWFVANDPNHHLYQEYGETYRSALEKAALQLTKNESQ
jgi:hypothetical protein